ncbi:MAG: type II toxin-antitoxin system RelE/ParE family toxin [Firmicutes bacterium]|nr:type II toxin-antitoxin system RelE/ParE family toxin [Bacillota bacterium]
METIYSKQADNFLQTKDDKTFNRIKFAIDKLPNGDVRKMKGFTNKYRLRVGDIRIIFTVDNAICIEKIDNRGQVYKN